MEGLHLMIDLETMGVEPDAAIIAIGAVLFTKGQVHDTFYRTIDLDSAVKSGGSLSASTIAWWLEQSSEARRAVLLDNVHLLTALNDFTNFLQGKELTGVWGNGVSFDNVILRSAYTKNGLKVPWPFYKDRCYRTFRAMHPALETHNAGVAHHALQDALHQVQYMFAVLNV